MSHYSQFPSIPQHCPPFQDILPRSIVFHSAKECSKCFQAVQELRVVSLHMSILSIPQDSTPFHNILTSSTEFHCDKLGTILFQTTQELSVASHYTTFHSIPQYVTPLCNILLHSIAFHYVKEGLIAFKPFKNSLLRQFTCLFTRFLKDLLRSIHSTAFHCTPL